MWFRLLLNRLDLGLDLLGRVWSEFMCIQALNWVSGVDFLRVFIRSTRFVLLLIIWEVEGYIRSFPQAFVTSTL